MIDYDKPADSSASSIEDLQAAFVQAGADLVTIANVRSGLLEAMEARKSDVKAKAALKDLSPRDIEALKAVLEIQAAAAAEVKS